MVYRNLPRLVLGLLAGAFGIAALVTGLSFVAFHTSNWNGLTEPSNPWAAALGAVFFLCFVVTGTGWLVLRGTNYDAWFRATHPGEPLHRANTDDYSGPADWKAAERMP